MSTRVKVSVDSWDLEASWERVQPIAVESTDYEHGNGLLGSPIASLVDIVTPSGERIRVRLPDLVAACAAVGKAQ